MANVLLKGIAEVEWDEEVGVVDAYIMFNKPGSKTKDIYQIPEDLYPEINKELDYTFMKIAEKVFDEKRAEMGVDYKIMDEPGFWG